MHWVHPGSRARDLCNPQYHSQGMGGRHPHLTPGPGGTPLCWNRARMRGAGVSRGYSDASRVVLFESAPATDMLKRFLSIGGDPNPIADARGAPGEYRGASNWAPWES